MTSRALLATFGLATASLAAQRPGQGDTLGRPLGGRGAIMGPGSMAEVMGDAVMRDPAVARMILYTPQHLLARKDALGLSGEQIARLTALRYATAAPRDAAVAEAHTHLREMERAAMSSTPDTAALRPHFEAAHAALGRAAWAELSAAAQAQWVLSATQRVAMETWADSMQAWMQQHRNMMRPTGPR